MAETKIQRTGEERKYSGWAPPKAEADDKPRRGRPPIDRKED